MEQERWLADMAAAQAGRGGGGKKTLRPEGPGKTPGYRKLSETPKKKKTLRPEAPGKRPGYRKLSEMPKKKAR